jgi:hypothetical protein
MQAALERRLRAASNGRTMPPNRTHKKSPSLLTVAAIGILCARGEAWAQDMEPRAYSASPIGTNFLVSSYVHTSGSVSLDPSVPITNVEASLNAGILGYQRTFDLLGRTASAAVLVPYIGGTVSGDVMEKSTQVDRRGLGDVRIRVAANLIGSPALSPSKFSNRTPTTTVGISLTITAPTGDYNGQHLVNIGSHRWAFKPEIGVSQPLGKWFVDAAAGVWVFTDNPDFLGGQLRGERPLWSVQVHGGYNMRPGFWLAIDATHYFGGETILNRINKHDAQSATRYGLTLAVPVATSISAKVSYASWLSARNSGKFNTIAVGLQYRWFDR